MENRWFFIPVVIVLLAACGVPMNPFLADFRVKGDGTPATDIPVVDIPITDVHLTVTGPATGDAPDYTAHAAPGHEADNYTIGAVSWEPDIVDVFGLGIAYTASVTVTADDGYTFAGLSNATISGYGAVIDANDGKTLTLSHTFAATIKAVSAIAIKIPPTKLTYTHGNTLDMSGLVVTLTHNDSTTEDVPFEDFGDYNLFAEPEDGESLSRSLHNDMSVIVRFGHLTADAGTLTVNIATPTVTWPTGLKAVSGITLSRIALPGNGTSSVPGTFAWVEPATIVTNTSGYVMRFTPNDTENYKTVDWGIVVTMIADIEMVWINAGTFTMGSSDAQDYGASPPHQVTLTAGFYMGRYEVTQTQYQTVTGTNPSYFSGSPASGETQGRRPVEMVTWYDAIEFCNKLSGMEGLSLYYTITGRTPTTGYPITAATVTVNSSATGYRLPTEAQWEYACRAGTTTAWYFGASDANIGNYAWYSGNSSIRTHEVGKKQPNNWGLYDMAGNMSEWCWDWYGDYASGAQNDPAGASSGSNRVSRGRSYGVSAQYVRSAYRSYVTPDNRSGDVGFRVVRP